MRSFAPVLLLLTSIALSGAAPVVSAPGQDRLAVHEERSNSVTANAAHELGGPIVIVPLDLDKRNDDPEPKPAAALVSTSKGEAKEVQPVIVLLGRDGPEAFDLKDLQEHPELSIRSIETRMELHNRGLFGSIGKFFSGALAKKVFKWVGWASIAVTIADALHIHLNPSIGGDQDNGSGSSRRSDGPVDSLASMSNRGSERDSKTPIIVLIPGLDN